jgi:hypothetical protein
MELIRTVVSVYKDSRVRWLYVWTRIYLNAWSQSKWSLKDLIEAVKNKLLKDNKILSIQLMK